MVTPSFPSIDRQALLDRTDLARIITDDRGPPDRSRRWLCPFHDDHHPSLGLTPDGRRFRCWSCGAKGNALDWIMLREGLSFLEAVGRSTRSRRSSERETAAGRQ